MIPVATMEFRIQDLIPAVNDRIAHFLKKCNDLTASDHPDTNDPEYQLCYRGLADDAKALTIGNVCNIPVQLNQVGEPNQPNLWLPGEPLPAGCAASLAIYNGRYRFADKNGNLKSRYWQIFTRAKVPEIVTPAALPEDKVDATLPGKDSVDPDTGVAYTRGKRLLLWARERQVDEWIAENAVGDEEVKLAKTCYADFKQRNNDQLDAARSPEATRYQWLLAQDPTDESDPQPPAPAPTPPGTPPPPPPPPPTEAGGLPLPGIIFPDSCVPPTLKTVYVK